ncbi:acyloxyacyl hydrolase [Psychroflexus salis]|uniref:Lipid A 3-O-deacylase (PagL) n=1 Tax=Psychroflexus salis TaxID=1526574 RepID=A0A916ZMA2_9FLAO|nr:acyloxyacyl hydrolase [Psychroflexus salis]GGE04552.1 hypothetical protein GCM10010831_02670 [Psychroflexus salis]
MPKLRLWICLSVFITGVSLATSQGEKNFSDAFQINALSGYILHHSPDIIHLIQGPTQGYMASWERQTYGKNEWEEAYNYPSFGASFIKQNMGSPELGSVYSLHADYRFFFFNRKLSLQVGTGLGYVENPFHPDRNPKNYAYGTNITGSFYAGLHFRKHRLFKTPLGIQVGAFLIHYSNGRTKSPNTSTNNYGIQLGINYELEKESPKFTSGQVGNFSPEAVKFNFSFSSGMNDFGIIGLNNNPFYVFTAYADKRFNRKSSLQLGTELFLTHSVKEFIKYRAIAFENDGNITGDEDWKRVGLFLGHELFIGKLSLITQAGYYVYYPINYSKQYYTRIGLKRYLSNNIFVSVMLKTHLAKAESMEYGIGIRL